MEITRRGSATSLSSFSSPGVPLSGTNASLMHSKDILTNGSCAKSPTNDGNERRKKHHKKKHHRQHARRLVDAPAELSFVSEGHLNMIVNRAGSSPTKELAKISTNNTNFLGDNAVVAKDTMDTVFFQPTAAFKVTLEFTEALFCDLDQGAVRDSTDWVLCSAMGNNVTYNKATGRLQLQQVRVSVQSNVPQLRLPFCLVLMYDEVEQQWIVEKMYR